MKKILNDFLTALTFLSRVPVKVNEFTELSTVYFPPVGFLLGIIISIFGFVFNNFFHLK